MFFFRFFSLINICLIVSFFPVVTDGSGRSKGYGFIRFTEENDQQRALIEMQHFPGISRRPIRVSLATPKRY